MYSEEDKSLLYNILGGSWFSYSITVISIINIEKTVLDLILNGDFNTYNKQGVSYTSQSLSALSERRGSDEEERQGLIVRSRRIVMLNAFINEVELKKVPLYINNIPELSRWRLQIKK